MENGKQPQKSCPLHFMAGMAQTKIGPAGPACATFVCEGSRCMLWSELRNDCRLNVALEAVIDKCTPLDLEKVEI